MMKGSRFHKVSAPPVKLPAASPMLMTAVGIAAAAKTTAMTSSMMLFGFRLPFLSLNILLVFPPVLWVYRWVVLIYVLAFSLKESD